MFQSSEKFVRKLWGTRTSRARFREEAADHLKHGFIKHQVFIILEGNILEYVDHHHEGFLVSGRRQKNYFRVQIRLEEIEWQKLL